MSKSALVVVKSKLIVMVNGVSKKKIINPRLVSYYLFLLYKEKDKKKPTVDIVSCHF